MFDIKFYKDEQNREPVKEFIDELRKKHDKGSRVRVGKIEYYIQLLSIYGTQIGKPFVDHIRGDIWELRPFRDRVFFFCCDGNKYILLHHFVKKTNKTPPREIDQAEKNMKSFIERRKYEKK